MDDTYGKPGSERPVENRPAAAETARRAVGDAAQRVRGVADRVRAGAESQKEGVAQRVGGTADVLRDTARQLQERYENSIARYVEQLAGALANFSDSINDKSAEELLGDVQSLARRNPALFVGGALAAGILLGRFARSSRARREFEPAEESSGIETRERAFGASDIGPGRMRSSEIGLTGEGGIDRGLDH